MSLFYSSIIRLALFATLGVSIAYSRDSTDTAPTPSITNQTITLRQQRESLAKRMIELKSRSSEIETDQTTTEAILRQLKTVDSIYLRHQVSLEDLQYFEEQLKAVEHELDDADSSDPSEPKPYSYLMVENSKDQLVIENQREEEAELALKNAKNALAIAHRELAEWENARLRLLKDREESPKEPTTTRLSEDVDLEELVARGNLAWRKVDVDVASVALKIHTTRRKLLEARIKIFAKDIEFSAADRDKQLEFLVGIESELKTKRKGAESRLSDLEIDHQKHLETLKEQNPASIIVEAAIDVWRQVIDGNRLKIVLLDSQLEHLSEIRTYWKRRYEFTNEKVEITTLNKWKDELDSLLEKLADSSNSVSRRRDSLTQIASQPLTNNQFARDSALGWWTEIRNSQRLELRDEYDASLQRIHSWIQSLERFQTDLKSKTKKKPDTGILSSLNAVIGFELAEAGDEKITIGRVFLLLGYIVLGLLAAYGLSRLVAVRLLSKFGIQLGNAVAIRSIAYYVLSIIVCVVAFQLLNIPLGAFQFLVGATTIAIAFASRDIMNNFMGGVILLLERPVRVGDAIQLGDLRGKVKHIGLRSTRLMTESNQDLILPNSSLLDKQVLNFTLSDQYALLSVVLDVDPEINIDEAKSKMLAAVVTHSLVVKIPSPFVLLKASDCYSLQFEIRFWVEHSSFVKCSVIQSEVLEAATRVCRIPKVVEEIANNQAPSQEVSALPNVSPNTDSATSGQNVPSINGGNKPGGLSHHEMGLVNKMLRHKR